MGRGSSKAGGKAGGGRIFSNAAFDEDKEDWEEFEKSFGPTPNMSDAIKLGGYIRTANAFYINEKFYNNKEDTLSQKDKETVEALDRMIKTHKTPRDGVFTRYVGKNAIQDTLGLSNKQMDILMQVGGMNESELAQLNGALKGTLSFSKSYSSTSAIKKHIFSGKPFRREISVPKGTPAFAANRKEHETVFGRNLKTELDHVSWDGKHIVLHERFVGYGE